MVEELSPSRSQGTPGRMLVYVHGGVCVSGPYWPQWCLAAALSRGLGMRTLVPLYRRAPEHPFPAGYDDITTVLETLAEQAAGPVPVAGDSSGGGLAAAIAVHRDDSARLALVSPWLDLALDASDDSRDATLATPGLRELHCSTPAATICPTPVCHRGTRPCGTSRRRWSRRAPTRCSCPTCAASPNKHAPLAPTFISWKAAACPRGGEPCRWHRKPPPHAGSSSTTYQSETPPERQS